MASYMAQTSPNTKRASNCIKMEWRSKDVAIEDGLIRLFGPPPECEERDRIDMTKGRWTISKKVNEAKSEDDNKIFYASALIEYDQESSSSVHVVTAPRSDSTTNPDSLKSLAKVIKDANKGNSASKIKSHNDIVEAGGLEFSIYSSVVGEAQSWLKALQKEAEMIKKEIKAKKGDSKVCTLSEMALSSKSSATQPSVPQNAGKSEINEGAGGAGYQVYPAPSFHTPATEVILGSVIEDDRPTQIYKWTKQAKWTPVDENFPGDEIQFLSGSAPLPDDQEGGSSSNNNNNNNNNSSSSSSSSSNTSPVDEKEPLGQRAGAGAGADLICFKTLIYCAGHIAEDLLDTLLSMNSVNHSGAFKSVEVIRSIEEGLDLLHICYNETKDSNYTRSRDVCARRGFRRMKNGTIVVFLDSAFPQDNPPSASPTCERMKMSVSYIISQANERKKGGRFTEMTLFCQLERSASWSRARCIEEVRAVRAHLVTITEALDLKPLTNLNIFGTSSSSSSGDGDGQESEPEPEPVPLSEQTFLNIPYPPTCPSHMVDEPDGASFTLRGQKYLSDKKKVPSADSVCQLRCVDIFDSNEKTIDICSRPDNRVYRSKVRGEDKWYFVMNIMVPMKKMTFSYVVYWEGDKSKIDEDTPFGRVAKPFFRGEDDDYRNARFKLIPRVKQGPYLVRVAVGEKPALLGNKLKQYYSRGENYFEIDIDVSSSVIANNTVGMCMSSSKSIRVDLGITIQGDDEEELPEVMLAAVTGANLDANFAKLLPNKEEL